MSGWGVPGGVGGADGEQVRARAAVQLVRHPAQPRALRVGGHLGVGPAALPVGAELHAGHGACPDQARPASGTGPGWTTRVRDMKSGKPGGIIRARAR
ncbi:hypothetical protein GCM10019017_22460 [Streptomyces showdoensis]